MVEVHFPSSLAHSHFDYRGASGPFLNSRAGAGKIRHVQRTSPGGPGGLGKTISDNVSTARNKDAFSLFLLLVEKSVANQITDKSRRKQVDMLAFTSKQVRKCFSHHN